VSDWLVPVSRHVRFAQKSGRSLAHDFETLQGAVLAGRLGKIVCDVRGSLVNLATGDTVWFYTTELEIGVFAVGRAGAPTKGKQPSVTVSIDRTRTRLLSVDPLPAATIRRWVPELRQGAVNLDIRPRAHTVLDAWLRERGDRDAELLAPLSATAWRTVGKGARSNVAMHDVIAPIARLLRSQDFAVGVETPVGPEPRLLARRVRDVVVVDVCRSGAGKGRSEALGAIGPLLQARWRIQRDTSDARLQATLWLAFSSRPHEDLTTFLEDLGILVSWCLRPGVVALTDRSKQRWYQYLGVR
jgi:hypothetical protein